jgi:glycosyltransferase involved in cell wall biosynthesis
LPSSVLSHIEFIDALPQEKLGEYLTNAYIAVFPSLFETFGKVSREPLYYDVPVIVNRLEAGLHTHSPDKIIINV